MATFEDSKGVDRIPPPRDRLDRPRSPLPSSTYNPTIDRGTMRRLLSTSRSHSAMHRPRNRQPQAQRARPGPETSHHPPKTRPQRQPTTTPGASLPYTPVPSIQHVVRGAAVSIVLKADQPTGREVQGVVQDLLTRGNHPRGIKVRLQDGRVGRVQRMIGGAETTSDKANPSPATPIPSAGSRRNYRFVADVRREDEYPEGPPPSRSLADFVSELAQTAAPPPPDSSVTVKCPICAEFEGDEIAVSRHVDSHFE